MTRRDIYIENLKFFLTIFLCIGTIFGLFAYIGWFSSINFDNINPLIEGILYASLAFSALGIAIAFIVIFFIIIEWLDI